MLDKPRSGLDYLRTNELADDLVHSGDMIDGMAHRTKETNIVALHCPPSP
jgi:hypothetical protein